MNTQNNATNAQLQLQSVLLDSLKVDKEKLELKSRTDSLKIDSLTHKISALQNQTYQLENSIFMNSNNLYPHRYSSGNPNSQR